MYLELVEDDCEPFYWHGFSLNMVDVKQEFIETT